MTIRQKPFSPTEFKTIYSKVPRATVEVVVTTGQGVVLVKRQEKSWQGQWHIPGGTILFKEPVEWAAKRIAQEELGIEVTVGPLIGYIEYPSEEVERGFGYSVGLAFLCQPLDPVNMSKWDVDKIRIFKQLPENLIVEQKELLKRVLRN